MSSTQPPDTLRFAELTPEEVQGLAALVRRVVAADARFTPEEKLRIDALAASLRAGDELWSAIATSAAHDQGDDAIREAMVRVSRPNVRALLLHAARAVCDERTDVTGLIAALSASWEERGGDGPYRV